MMATKLDHNTFATSAVSVNDHNNQIQFSNNLCSSLSGLLYSARSAHKNLIRYNAQVPFIPNVACATSLTIHDITILHIYVNYSQS